MRKMGREQGQLCKKAVSYMATLTTVLPTGGKGDSGSLSRDVYSSHRTPSKGCKEQTYPEVNHKERKERDFISQVSSHLPFTKTKNPKEGVSEVAEDDKLNLNMFNWLL